MWSFFSEPRVRQLSVFWSALIIVGIFLSGPVRILPSIGVAGLFLTSVGHGIGHQRIAQRAHWPAMLSFTLVYLVHLLTGLFYGGPPGAALGKDLLLQLPFLLLPAAFLLLPTWLAAHKNALWLLLIGCCVISATGSTVNYLLHHEVIDEIYLRSKVMPTLPDHIRFSLLVTMAVLAGTVLLFSQALPVGLRRLTAAGVLFLFVFQHLLAVRSGLVTMYAAGALWLAWLGWQQRRWKAVLGTATLVLGLAGLCLALFPTLQNKITNTRDDAGQLQSVDAANNYSVTGRVYSYQVAWAIIREQPLLGVSKVAMADEMAHHYRSLYPQIAPEHYLMPHNQFIYNLVAYGVLGLLVFMLGFYYPLWVGFRTRNILLLLLYAVISISFLVEYTLETQVGILTGLFFLLLAGAPTAPAAGRRALGGAPAR